MHTLGMTPEKPIPLQLLEMAHSQQWPAGTHLGAQKLADQLRVSRSPVNDALALLHDKGVLVREPNRGYFLARPVDKPVAALAESLGLEAEDQVTAVYFQLADDRLRGQLPDEFTETAIKQRYRLTPAQLNTLLSRMANEGWIEKRPGYGWAFSSMLTTSDSLLQSYRLRLALEPAALLEPGYRLDAQVIARCRAAEQHLLSGGIETDTADQLHERGVRFHESLVEASGNPFFIDTIRRVNRVRRLLSYRSMQNRQRYREHCDQHLAILDLLERERQAEAAEALRSHLQSTLRNLGQISGLLQGAAPTQAASTTPSPRPVRCFMGVGQGSHFQRISVGESHLQGGLSRVVGRIHSAAPLIQEAGRGGVVRVVFAVVGHAVGKERVDPPVHGAPGGVLENQVVEGGRGDLPLHLPRVERQGPS